MKIILNENQFKLLLEQGGFDEFAVEVSEKYPDSVYLLRFISDFVKKSGCQKIDIEPLKYGAFGLSLVDRVVINKKSLELPLSNFLYTLFHEVAHQYQYKKYGIDKMYGIYTGDVSVDEGAKFMKYVENVADDFAIRKLREINKLFDDKIKINANINKIYEKIPIDYYKNLINIFIKKIKDGNYTSKEDISEILYNYVKNGK
jgi:hypothetical protein